MPQRWVVRRDMDGKAQNEPMRCFLPHAIVAEPGLRTIDQCINGLLQEGEAFIGDGDHRLVVLDG
jgi:hypothetical protein